MYPNLYDFSEFVPMPNRKYMLIRTPTNAIIGPKNVALDNHQEKIIGVNINKLKIEGEFWFLVVQN